MKIQHIPGVAPLYTNTFLIVTDAGHGIIVDAAAAPQTYLDALQAEQAQLTHILLTHGHYDHVGAVAALRKATGCKVYMDPVDAAGNQMLPLTRDLVDENWPANGELKIDELTFKIYHTPGHTPGSVCLLCGELLFSGDTLFAGSCGRTDFPGGSMQQMQQSLSLLAELPIPDTVQVLPGHESFSTLGRERRSNPYMNGAWF
ncbi:MBL fold metallo-hydrolase [Gemmiger formicilis]|uniref:MBL fold metallo-hydrolase n=1 Tax=Subdoligranulum variabile TaxID=214851 RepID=A0A921IJA8_9FIRM|nr:MBL fold metallo-hydrolase [Gemmiger formicilis]MBM6898999.1 MBL fold metallo-hydrolase [Gemmiger formicilis]HJG27814.1 MBL fold metallo-hydrolase [Subdoligranulum variabile]